MKRYWLVLVLISVLVAIGIVAAQDDQGRPNDPATNPRANACFTGGSLQGLCNKTDADRDGDVDQQDIDWMWRCGWYIIRAEKGSLAKGEYPDECYTPPVIPTPTAAPVDPCIDPKKLTVGGPVTTGAIDPCDHGFDSTG